MVVVAHQQLQRMFAGRQVEFVFGLAPAEMDMVEITGDFAVERRSFRIDQEMMVAAAGMRRPRRRDRDVLDAEADRRAGRDRRAIDEIAEEHARAGRSGRARLFLHPGHDLDLDRLRHHRRIMRDVIMVGEEELQPVPARRQRNLGLGLAAAEMQMVEIGRDRPVERRQRRVDQQVVMAGMASRGAGRNDLHAADLEADRELGTDDARAVLQAQELQRHAGRGRAALLRPRSRREHQRQRRQERRDAEEPARPDEAHPRLSILARTRMLTACRRQGKKSATS